MTNTNGNTFESMLSAKAETALMAMEANVHLILSAVRDLLYDDLDGAVRWWARAVDREAAPLTAIVRTTSRARTAQSMADAAHAIIRNMDAIILAAETLGDGPGDRFPRTDWEDAKADLRRLSKKLEWLVPHYVTDLEDAHARVERFGGLRTEWDRKEKGFSPPAVAAYETAEGRTATLRADVEGAMEAMRMAAAMPSLRYLLAERVGAWETAVARVGPAWVEAYEEAEAMAEAASF